MAHPPLLLVPVLLTPVARFLRNLPTWATLLYFGVALMMAIGLTAWFLASARTRAPNRPGGAGPAAVLVVLFFPLLAISVIWPITLPVVAVVLVKAVWPARPPAGGR